MLARRTSTPHDRAQPRGDPTTPVQRYPSALGYQECALIHRCVHTSRHAHSRHRRSREGDTNRCSDPGSLASVDACPLELLADGRCARQGIASMSAPSVVARLRSAVSALRLLESYRREWLTTWWGNYTIEAFVSQSLERKSASGRRSRIVGSRRRWMTSTSRSTLESRRSAEKPPPSMLLGQQVHKRSGGDILR